MEGHSPSAGHWLRTRDGGAGPGHTALVVDGPLAGGEAGAAEAAGVAEGALGGGALALLRGGEGAVGVLGGGADELGGANEGGELGHGHLGGEAVHGGDVEGDLVLGVVHEVGELELGADGAGHRELQGAGEQLLDSGQGLALLVLAHDGVDAAADVELDRGGDGRGLGGVGDVGEDGDLGRGGHDLLGGLDGVGHDVAAGALGDAVDGVGGVGLEVADGVGAGLAADDGEGQGALDEGHCGGHGGGGLVAGAPHAAALAELHGEGGQPLAGYGARDHEDGKHH